MPPHQGKKKSEPIIKKYIIQLFKPQSQLFQNHMKQYQYLHCKTRKIFLYVNYSTHYYKRSNFLLPGAIIINYPAFLILGVPLFSMK